MKRPILYWVILFILGEILYKMVAIYMVGFIGILFMVFLLRNRRLRKKWVLHFVGVACFFLGVFCMNLQEKNIALCCMEEGTKVSFEGIVLKREETTAGVSYVLYVTRWNQNATSIKVQSYLKKEQPLVLGSKVCGVAVTKRYKKASNPGGYDEESYKHGQGIMITLRETVFNSIETPRISWRGWLENLQDCLEQIYCDLFSEEHASLAVAMVLGEKKNLDTDLKALYQRNGIAHLIAISGLHVAMIGGSLYKILRRLTGSYSVAALVGGVFICSYGLMTGLSGATFRAVIMLLTSVGADVTGRRYDGLTAVSLALFIMLIGNPYQITQVGFLLSFGAVLGIVLIQPVWKHLFKNIPKCLDGLFVSFSVQMVLTPIMLWFFYEIPVYSILLNVVVVPLMNILLAMLIFCGVLGLFTIDLAGIPAFFAEVIFVIYERLCHWAEYLPGHTLCTGRPTLEWIFIYYLILALGVWFLYQKQKKWSMSCLFCILLLFGCFLLPSSLQVCMFDVGQGDGIYIRTSEKQHILVDGGSSTQYNIGQYILKNGLKYYGVSSLDYVFVTHSDSDHFSGIQEILKNQLVSVENIVFPAITNPDESYQELVRLAREQGCRIYYIKKGDVLDIDDVQIRCLNPSEQSYDDKNAGSIVLQVKYHNFDMLLTGDLTKDGEQKILGECNERIEVLKVGHHGSATSTSLPFLQKICPMVACVSVGENNMYGHPAKEVMERLAQFTQKIYLTKDCGAITIETDGIEYVVDTFLE